MKSFGANMSRHSHGIIFLLLETVHQRSAESHICATDKYYKGVLNCYLPVQTMTRNPFLVSGLRKLYHQVKHRLWKLQLYQALQEQATQMAQTANNRDVTVAQTVLANCLTERNQMR
jgi:hypothetical protein